MMVRQEKAALCVGLEEVQAYARLETGEEEALIAGLLRTASELCETFLNQALVARAFEATVRATDGWTLLPLQPVRTITAMRQAANGEALSPSSYRYDIDYEGRGLVAGLTRGETFVVSGSAGLAAEGNSVPEPIRQGIVRLAAYMFAHRDAQGGELPKDVTALWRPYRRAGLCR